MNNNHSLHTISVEYLYENMRLTHDIYSSGKEHVLLLRKDTVLTNAMISRLKKLCGESKNVCVTHDMYHSLLNRELPRRLRQDFLEKKVGYGHSKKLAIGIIDSAMRTGSVDHRQTEAATHDITVRLNTVDAALIFQCINGQNSIDEYLYTHSINVAMLNGLMGKWLRLPPEDIKLLITCGLLHDIGKTKIAPDLLNAPRRLLEHEYEIVKRHADYSYDILSKTPGLHEMVATVARHHHERSNGSGYPDGLITEEIPLFSRVTAIADIYDAMVSRRSYKNAHSPFEILSQLAHGKFSDLDYSLVQLFLSNMPLELVGKSVLLSDGSVATVRYVDTANWKFPLVEIDGETFYTSPERRCVCMVI